VTRTLTVHDELLRDVSPDYRLAVRIADRRAVIEPGRTDITMDVTPPASSAPAPSPHARRTETARAKGLERSRDLRFMPVVSPALVTTIGAVLAARAAAKF
jgi:hypothetical protein